MPLFKKSGRLLAAAVMMLSVGCNNVNTAAVTAVTLNISAASSLNRALDEVNNLYTQSKPWVTITPNYAGSGTLQTQIENGAPCDVFLSAAAAQMDNLQNKDQLLSGSRKNLLTNRIVLIVPKNSTLGIRSFNDLTLGNVKLIAIGDPKSVPAGSYAMQALSELGIFSAVQSKLILGANVIQVLQYVSGGNVDAGIVYATDALNDNGVSVITSGPPIVNAAIVYPAAIIKTSNNIDTAKDYVAFLASPQAAAVFEKYGFRMAAE